MADKSDSQDKDVDELDDDFGSDDENADPNVFRISNTLTPPSAMSYSAAELHCEQTHVLDHCHSDVRQPLFTRGTSTSTPATNEVRVVLPRRVSHDNARPQTSSGQKASKSDS